MTGKAAAGTLKDLAECPWGESRKARAFEEKSFLSNLLPTENPGRELVSVEMVCKISC